MISSGDWKPEGSKHILYMLQDVLDAACYTYTCYTNCYTYQNHKLQLTKQKESCSTKKQFKQILFTNPGLNTALEREPVKWRFPIFLETCLCHMILF